MEEKNIMDKEEELEFLKKRYRFRMELFSEYCWVDNRLIPDITKFGKDTNEIMNRIIELEKTK